jgi:hypothetical protein
MTKHTLPATHLDSERTVWLRPDPDPKQDPGWRLRLDKERGEPVRLLEEQVLPECVDDPASRRCLAIKANVCLTRADAEWLHAALGEMLQMEEP